MKTSVIMAALIGLAALSTPAMALKKSSLRADQVRGVYELPKEAKHKSIYDALKKRRTLEELRILLSPLRLPRPLRLQLKGCDGKIDVSYQDDVVTFCYEYVEYLQRHAPNIGTPGGLTPADVIFSAVFDTFLHEAGHAVFDMLEVPVFGREEDAADYFSAYILLQFSPHDARRFVQGVAFIYASESKVTLEKVPDIRDFAGEHGLPAQRYFNVLCIAYGSDPKTYAKAITRGGLPKKRAEGCDDEYKMLQRAFRKLIRPNVDQALLRKVRARVQFKWDELIPLTAGRDAPPMSR
jgi:Putative metallopeptidase